MKKQISVLDLLKLVFFTLFLLFSSYSSAFVLSFDSDDFGVTTIFNDVSEFRFDIDIDGELSSGVYLDSVLNSVDYAVSGVLNSPTPSGFPGFELERLIDGADFYAQGSSLWFEISATANLSDGLQADELVANSEGEIFIFNGREIENGRFHPALLVLNSNGTGQIQNSNNVPNTTVGEIAFGAEYITNLSFNLGNLIFVEGVMADSGSDENDSGGGTSELWLFCVLMLLPLIKKTKRLF